MGGPSRKSLSDWWGARPDNSTPPSAADESDVEAEEKCDSICSSPPKRLFSPAKRSIPNFTIGDDSDTASVDYSHCSLDCGSPRKRVAMSPSPMMSARGSSHVLGASPQEVNFNTAMMSTLRGICADYFENNVSPILRYVQNTQEQLVTQLKDVTAQLQRKANAEDVATHEEIENIAVRAATSRTDDSKVAMRVRLEHLSASLNQKASTDSVPTLAQLGLKADAKEQGELKERVRIAEQKVASLSEELCQLKKADKTVVASQEPADIAKVKTVFAAAGMRVDRQLKEMRQQMQQLREECLGQDVGERWPGRKLDTASVGSVASFSDNGSDRLSVGASAAGSLTAPSEMALHDQAELKKIRAIVAVAGKAFSRDLNDVRKQIRELRTEMHAGK